MMKQLKLLFTLAFIASLSACSNPEIPDDSNFEDAVDIAPGIHSTGQGKGTLPASWDALDQNGRQLQPESLEQIQVVEVTELLEPIIFFALDSYELDEAGIEIVKYFSLARQGNPKQEVIVQGHTDERGSPEYNLALGEKRAKSVAKAMVLFGITASQIEEISYGEEQPAVHGSNEAAWRKNRRVEIVIR